MDMRAKEKISAQVILTENEIAALDFSDLAPAQRVEDPGVLREDGYFITPDGIQLFWQSWHSELAPRRGCVALMHGYGEHSGRYDHVATAMVRAGYDVMAIDARGHGRSTGTRAHVNRFHDYVSDLALLKRNIESRWPHLPLFVVGHSNGGLITLRYALSQPSRVRGFIVTSPLCGLKVEISTAKALAGRVMSRAWPEFALPSGIDPRDVSQEAQVVARYATDPLVLGVATARYFTEIKAAFVDTLARAEEIDQPFLFLLSGSDSLVDSKAAEKLFHRLNSPERELEVYPDLFHEILNEGVWDEITRRIIAWMERHRI